MKIKIFKISEKKKTKNGQEFQTVLLSRVNKFNAMSSGGVFVLNVYDNSYKIGQEFDLDLEEWLFDEEYNCYKPL